MGKLKEDIVQEDSARSISKELSDIPLVKKHKKHKHKKHKKKKSHNESVEKVVNELKSNHTSNKASLKRIGSKPLRKPEVQTIRKDLDTNMSSISLKIPKKKLLKTNKGKDSGTSSEEERWLDAIESGKLEEVDDELKKIKPKDPKLMTARQRAMFERKTDTEPTSNIDRLISLPTGYKEKVMTAEAIQKAALKSLKRKQLADEKREKDKKKTMERLLKKQETKVAKIVPKGKISKRQVPVITYRITAEQRTITLPPGEVFPLKAAKVIDPPAPVRCGIPSCPNIKKYACSKTGIPLCSLECYRANLMRLMS